MHGDRSGSGLSKTDLVLILALLATLAVSMVPRLKGRLASARDAQRRQDMQRVQAAIERYHSEHGSWPAAHESREHGGWDVSNDGDFIPVLVREGYLTTPAADPIDDEQYQYRYRVFPAGQFGCQGESPYYVLGLRAFETEAFAGADHGGFRCDKRDWAQEFAWVTGAGASER